MQVRRLQDQLDSVPDQISGAKAEAIKYTDSACEKVKSELYLEIKELSKKIDDLSQHVEDVRAESKRAREHLEVNLQRMNTHIVEVETHGKNVDLKLSEEVMARESDVQKTNSELKEMLSAEKMERER